MCNNCTNSILKEVGLIRKVATILTMLPEQEQERFCSRLEGYLDGINYALTSQDLSNPAVQTIGAELYKENFDQESHL